MTSSRKQRRAVARWHANTRQWATDTARSLALTLYQDAEPPVTPYDVGVVLDPGEKPWVELLAHCSLDRPLPGPPGAPSPPAMTDWLVTNRRVIGRFADSSLHGWRWEWMTGCLIDLSSGYCQWPIESPRWWPVKVPGLGLVGHGLVVWWFGCWRASRMR